MQVTTKDTKKGDKAWCVKGVFQIQPPISGVNFPNNISVSQFRVNMKETEHDTTFETSFLTVNPRINPSIVLVRV